MFYLDENLSPDIAIVGAARGVDITDWKSCGQAGKRDDEQLRFAAAEGRILVTLNRRDFRRWSRRFQEAGEAHAGVLLVKENFPPWEFGAVVAALAAFAREHPDGMTPYTWQTLLRVAGS